MRKIRTLLLSAFVAWNIFAGIGYCLQQSEMPVSAAGTDMDEWQSSGEDFYSDGEYDLDGSYSESLNQDGDALVYYVNEENNYKVLLDDAAELLSETEIQKLVENMKGLTKYGTVAFATTDSWSQSTEKFAKYFCEAYIREDEGVVFVIDMYNRYIWMYPVGKNMEKVLSDDYCTLITDNVYTYATDKKYYKCAKEAFSQAETLLSGHRIAEPMRWISNGLLALVFAFLINFIIVKCVSASKKASNREVLDSLPHSCRVKNINVALTNVTKKYSPRSSKGGGGGRSGGGGGHHGGGHRF